MPLVDFVYFKYTMAMLLGIVGMLNFPSLCIQTINSRHVHHHGHLFYRFLVAK
jgi:hypothetical protein